MSVDFGRVSDDYATWRLGFPDSFYTSLADMGVDSRGKRLLDLGTGTGTLARGFTRRGARVTGLDPSAEQIAAAQRLDAQAGLDIPYLEATAEKTGLDEGSFDIVVAGQCWHWFDRPAAAREARRLLVPGGCLVIAHFDWIPLPGNVVAATEALIERHNPGWRLGGGNGIYGRWLTDAGSAGFTDIETRSYDEDAIYSHEAWRGRVRASNGVAAGDLDADQVAAFDAELGQILARDFPDDPLAVLHRVFILTARRP